MDEKSPRAQQHDETGVRWAYVEGSRKRRDTHPLREGCHAVPSKVRYSTVPNTASQLPCYDRVFCFSRVLYYSAVGVSGRGVLSRNMLPSTAFDPKDIRCRATIGALRNSFEGYIPPQLFLEHLLWRRDLDFYPTNWA